MELSERLRIIRKELKYTQSEFSESIGLKQGSYSALETGAKHVLSSAVKELLQVKHNINIEWLLSGKGSKYTTHEEAEAKKTIKDEAFLVPLFPLSAQGGTLDEFSVSKDYHCEKIVTPVKGADFVITVNNESMEPDYPLGSQVIVKKINERAFIDWGQVYVLDTCNGVLIKIVAPGEQKGYIRCLSLNPDPIYAPFDVHRDDIYGFYRVIVCIIVK
jgi:transcriptional regulator with XRE-family HTH domain